VKKCYWIGILLAACPSTWAQQYIISTFAGGQPPPLTSIAGVDASIGRPSAVATDSAGNVYFGASLGCVFKLDGQTRRGRAE
jgi:hypothetical protein